MDTFLDATSEDQMKNSELNRKKDEEFDAMSKLPERTKSSAISIKGSASVNSHISSLSSSPASLSRSLGCSPKYLNSKHLSLEELLSHSPPACRARLTSRLPSTIARDATQPISGCLSPHAGSSSENLNHKEENEEEEEDEGEERDSVATTLGPHRPRSRTCPESRAWKRRLRLRTERRPASPPPYDVEMSLLSHQLSVISLKQELHIPNRELPLLPENTTDKPETAENT